MAANGFATGGRGSLPRKQGAHHVRPLRAARACQSDRSARRYRCGGAGSRQDPAGSRRGGGGGQGRRRRDRRHRAAGRAAADGRAVRAHRAAGQVPRRSGHHRVRPARPVRARLRRAEPEPEQSRLRDARHHLGFGQRLQRAARLGLPGRRVDLQVARFLCRAVRHGAGGSGQGPAIDALWPRRADRRGQPGPGQGRSAQCLWLCLWPIFELQRLSDRRDGEPAARRRYRHPRRQPDQAARRLCRQPARRRGFQRHQVRSGARFAALGAGRLHFRSDRQLSARQGERHVVQVDRLQPDRPGHRRGDRRSRAQFGRGAGQPGQLRARPSARPRPRRVGRDRHRQL